jgi:hypothetical protein
MVAGMRQAMNQVAIVGQQEQPFGLAIQSPGSIDVRERNAGFEGGVTGAFIGKRGEHPIGLVEEEGGHLLFQAGNSIQKQGEQDRKQQRGGQGKVEGEVFPFNANIPRQTAKGQVEAAQEIKPGRNQHEHQTDEEQ